MRFKFSSRDKQKRGSASSVRSARHCGQLAMYGVNQEHFCVSYLNADNGNWTSLFIVSLWVKVSFSPWRDMSLRIHFLICPFYDLSCTITCFVPRVIRVPLSMRMFLQVGKWTYFVCPRPLTMKKQEIGLVGKSTKCFFIKVLCYFQQETLILTEHWKWNVLRHQTNGKTTSDHIKGLLQFLQWLTSVTVFNTLQ